VVALFTGILALVRFYSKKGNTFLFIAVGFIGTAVLDGYHGVATSATFAERFPSSLPSLAPWSWLASRIYLSVFLAVSWIAWRREQRLGDAGRVAEGAIYFGGIVLTLSCFLIFAFIPLPAAYYPGHLFPRPEEWLPALFFLIAFIGFLGKGQWRSDQFESWLVLSLVVSVTLQCVYMSSSQMLFDGMFDAAHLLKVLSYVLVCIGLLVSVYETYCIVDSTKMDLEASNKELSIRIEEANLSRLRAEQAEWKLSEVATQLAMPSKSFEDKKTYRLNEFSLSDMMDCGAAVRNLSSHHATERSFANGLVRLIYEKFRDPNGNSEFALVRMFRIEFFQDLEPALQDYVRSMMPTVEAETSCLVLAGTIGKQSTWCDVAKSAGHQAIPLPSAEAVRRLPMIAQLLRQLGIDVGSATIHRPGVVKRDSKRGVFHVPDAKGSSTIPAQEEFVIPNGIQSVVGFGDILPDGKMFAVIGFATTEISVDVANLMSHLAYSAKIALLKYCVSEGSTIAKIQTLDQLLGNHEQIVADQDALLRQAIANVTNSNADLKQFAYVASHDLQEPLRKVTSFCQMLREEYSHQLDEDAQSYIRYAVDGAVRMKALVTDLLDYSRIESQGKALQPTDANVACAEAIELLQEAIDVSDANISVGVLPTIRAEHGQLVRLFQNFIGNAIKYRSEKSPCISIHAEEEIRNWAIIIQDNGIGIEPQYYERILKRLEILTGQDIRPHVVYKRSFAHKDFKERYNAYKGNAYGLANTLQQTAILKPSLKSKKVDNLYYTGQLTVPGPGVPPSIISGRVVANEVFKDFRRKT